MKRLFTTTVVFFMIFFTGCSSKSGNISKEAPKEQQKVIESTSQKDSEKTVKEPTKTEETKVPVEPQKPAEPVVKKDKLIVIDPGHASKANLEKEQIAPNSSEYKIKDGGGATGVATKNPEYALNMKVALKLKSYLEKEGFKVLMTKTDINKSMGNIERAKVGNDAGASLVIRIHADSDDSSSTAGASMLIPKSTENTSKIYNESKRYGGIVYSTLIKEVGMKSRGVFERSDMTGFNWSKVPVILVEMGFLSNPNEDKQLNTDSYQDKIASALCKGIVLCFK